MATRSSHLYWLHGLAYGRAVNSRRVVWSRVAAWGVVLAALSGCRPGHSSDAPLSVRPSARVPTKKEQESKESGIISTLVGTMSEGTFGPHLSLRPAARLVVWAAPRGQQPGVHSLVVPYTGTPGASTRLTPSVEGLRSFELSDFGPSGALAMLTRRSGSQEVLELLEISGDGKLAAGPHVVAETPTEILWTDARPTASGAIVFWAEVQRGAADIYALQLPAGGVPGRPERVARAVSAWQLGGAARPLLVTLEGPPSSRTVVLRKFAETAQPEGAPLTLAQGFRGGLDLDLASAQHHTVVVFSEKTTFENRLRRVVIDENFRVVESVDSLTPARGEQALVRLVSGPQTSEVYAVWEEPARRPLRGRSLLVGRLDAHGHVNVPSATLAAPGSESLLPLFTMDGGTLIGLAESYRCEIGRSCDAPPIERLLLRTSRELTAVQTSPLELAQMTRQPAALVWDPQCNERGCFALGAEGKDNPAVFVLDLAGTGGLVSPLVAETEAPSPRVLRQEVVGRVPELATLRGKARGEGALLAWVSYFDSSLPEAKVTKPAPDGRMAPVRALLETQSIDDDKQGAIGVRVETVISYRARSLGGVSLASAPGRPSLLGWSALDAGAPHLFLTSIDEAGKKLKQKVYERPGGEVSDIAAVATASGYLVAWVDGRSANAEVYAALVNDQLEPLGNEQRLSDGAEQATGVTIAKLDGAVVVVWADARGSSRPGFADLHMVSLDEKTAEPLGATRRLAATELHSHSPALATLGSTGDTALLGWLEADPASEKAPSVLFLAEIDGAGRFVAPPTEVPLPGRARGFSAECDREECHIVASLDVSDRGELWGLSWKGRGTPSLSPLVVLEGPPSQTVAPLLVGNQVYYVDEGATGQALLRRLTLRFQTTN